MTDAPSGAAEAAPAPEATPAPASIPEKPSPSARAAVDNAFASLDREEAQPPRPVQSQTQPEVKPEAKATTKAAAEKKAEPAKPSAEKPKAAEAKAPEKADPAKPVQSRAPDGKFAPAGAAEGEGAEPVSSPATAPKPTAFPDPPKRFSEDARTAWNEAPEPVRAEIHRATRELETGLQKYKADADAFEQVRAYDELAKKQGTTLQAAMSKYVGMEQLLRKDFVGGLEQLCQNRGITLRGLAAQIMGQKPEAVAAKQDQTVSALQREIASLKQQIGGVSQTIEQQRSESITTTVTAFAAEPGHERFEDLAQDIKFFLDNKRASNLQEAYELAERLNPAPSSSPAATPVATPQEKPAADQTRKGTLAVHGAPSSGSDPATRKPPSSARNAVDEAFARLGL